MNFSEKLRDIRQQKGLSQEQLAEKIGVSRQAITKWETGKGLPDIENMMILSEIFKTTLDDLIADTVKREKKMYVSDTVCDIDCERHFDIRIGNAWAVTISSGKDEKLHIRLQSDTIEEIGEAFKIKLDPGKNRLDVDCTRSDKMSRFEAQEALSVIITLPEKYADHVELGASVRRLEISDLHLRRLEYDGNAAEVVIRGSSGSLEFTGKEDYEITTDAVKGRLDVNQWKARTLLHIPGEHCPKVINRGRKCEVCFLKNGEMLERADCEETEGEVSVSGIFSELIVHLEEK